MTGCSFLINPIILCVYLKCIVYANQNLILVLKTNLSSLGVEIIERGCD